MNTAVKARTDGSPKPQVVGERGKFSMRGLPLLAQGTANHPMATVDNLWLSVKVYASGGENALHAHMVEDHAFVVLQGRATFFFEDGSSCEVLPFEGIMLPKGAQYKFEAGVEENLVLLRMGGAQRKTQGTAELRDTGGPMELKGNTIIAGGIVKNGREARKGTPSYDVIAKPGQFFPKGS